MTTDITSDAGTSSPSRAGGTGIRIDGLSKTFHTGRGKTVTALQDTHLHTDKGSFLALLGPSGCGKSTILRILADLEHPTTGVVFVDGKTPAQLRRDSELGIAFQDHALLPWRSVLTNIRLVFEIAGRRPDKAYIDELIQLVGLTGFEKAKPAQLSGGMRQRVSIARALALKPSVLLLDEPFGALDAQVRKELRDWLRRLHDEVPVTTVFVTHDQEEALEVADEIVVINGGRVEQVGSPDDLYDKPANDFVMRFLGPVTELGGALVRPHDIELHVGDPGGGVPGTVSRITRVGFEMRVEVRAGEQDALVTLTRTELQALAVDEGSPVHIRVVAGAPVVPVAGAAAPGGVDVVPV
jgi:ABC-type sulfate/molybdate transport systems ATPase subunit